MSIVRHFVVPPASREPLVTLPSPHNPRRLLLIAKNPRMIGLHKEQKMASPSNFYAQELEHALREHSFGLCDYSIHDATALQCAATVTLLEGRKLQVTLRNAGYSIESDLQQIVYEAIEDLLASASPLFKQKRQELLIKALEKLQAEYVSTEDD